MSSWDNPNFETTIATYAETVTAALTDRFSEREPEYLYEAAAHPIRAGGKRLRPTILLLVTGAVGPDNIDREDVMPAAVSVELVHTLSLVHDDLIDEDDLRRGEQAVHAEWDAPTAIIAGDVLFAKAFEELLETNATNEDMLECQRALLQACRQLCEGQALDLSFESRDSVTETEYIEMARLKTGALFEAAARMGVVLAGGDDSMAKRAAAYGRNLGIAFQIYDDVLDLDGETETLGKTRGSDVLQGKETLITIHARRHGLDLSDSSVSTESNDGELASRLESVGSIAFARNRATEYAETAQQFLNPFPETMETTLLHQLANLAVHRER